MKVEITLYPGSEPPADERDVLVWYDECHYANFGRGHFDITESEWNVNDWPGGSVLYWADVPPINKNN